VEDSLQQEASSAVPVNISADDREAILARVQQSQYACSQQWFNCVRISSAQNPTPVTGNCCRASHNGALHKGRSAREGNIRCCRQGHSQVGKAACEHPCLQSQHTSGTPHYVWVAAAALFITHSGVTIRGVQTGQEVAIKKINLGDVREVTAHVSSTARLQ
jgi:hypothetical protein